MNKQVAIAGLLGAASASCEGPFVTSAEEFKAQMEQALVDEQAKTAGYLAAQEASTAAFNARDANYENQVAIMEPFQEALTQATNDWSAKNDEITAHTEDIATYTDTVATTLQAKETADEAYNTAVGLVNDQQAIQDDLDAAVTSHTTEKATLEGIQGEKLTAQETATNNWNDAVTAKSDAVDAKAELCDAQGAVICNVANLASCTCTMGEAQLLVLADQADTNADNDIDDGNNGGKQAVETTKWAAYDNEKNDYDENAKLMTLYAQQCKFYDSLDGQNQSDGAYLTGVDTDNTTTSSDNYASATDKWDCDAIDNSPQKTLKAAVDTKYVAADVQNNVTANQAWTDWDTAKTEWESAVNDLGDAKCTQAEAAALEEVAQANEDAAADNINTALTNDVSDKLQLKQDAEGAYNTATTNVQYVTTQLENAVLDAGRSQDVLTRLQGELEPIADDKVVKNYLYSVQVDLKAASEAAKQEAQDRLVELNALKELAQATVDRAQLQLTFYTDLRATADLAKFTDDSLVEMNADAILTGEDAVESAEMMYQAAISECKQEGYKQAQLAKKAKMDQDALDEAARETTAADYAVLLEKPTGGVAGAICSYESVGVGEPRPECGEGLCCGAAQKVMKDGTKLAIETCQLIDARTYTYYPPLPANAIEAPAAETWRFQCISGAQKLVAAATAALAASYMMA